METALGSKEQSRPHVCFHRLRYVTEAKAHSSIMKKATLTVVLVCLAAQPLRACLNSLSATTLDGHKVRRSDIAFWEIRDSRKRDMTVEGAEMERKFRGKCDFTNRNDYAVALVFLGRHDEAISLLQSLEKETPNHYSTAANLGTAYELSGNNELALQWSRRCVFPRFAFLSAGFLWRLDS